MTDSELKLVADHMGHNLNVHTDVYRLQSSLLEKTKVARVLIAMENGCVDKFRGKTIQDIPIDSMFNLFDNYHSVIKVNYYPNSIIHG